MFDGQGFLVMLGDDGEATRGIGKALELLGGKALEIPPNGDLAAVGDRSVKGIIASIDAMATCSSEQARELRRRSNEIPLMLFPARGDTALSSEAGHVLRALGAPELTITDPAPVRTFEFSQDSHLWPFGGLRLTEERQRIVPAVGLQGRGIDPLVTSQHGCVYFRWRRGPQRVFVSMTSPLEAVKVERLQDEFGPSRFAALLPLMLFARQSLGDSEWRTPSPLATFMIDDPNLRFMHYGFVDYQALAEAANDRDLHFTIAMIPIDCRKTRSPVARFMQENSRYVSLVPHGVEHLRHEFAREVALDRAAATLREGQRRMRIHHEATGVGFPRAMTFPHGRCNSTWLEAMRRTGFQAAFAARAFSQRPKGDGIDPLFEMHPAEMAFRGFPVVNRFRAEDPKEQLLFRAWLGKPLVVYTHHDFFRDGMDATFEVADFLDRQVAPTWDGVEGILNANYQSRRSGQDKEVRVFSNAVSVAADHLPISRVLKPGAAPPVDELARIDGAEVEVMFHEGLGLVIDPAPRTREPLTITFEPRSPASIPRPYRMPLRAGMRRLATEIRDQSSAAVAIGR